MPPRLTQHDLQILCWQWQEKLRLQDWDVAVVVARERDFENANCAAEVRIHEAKRRAILRILDPQDDEPRDHWPHSDLDQERSIVHELLHVLFRPLHIREKDETAEEQVIHSLSCLLVKLKREAEKSDGTTSVIYPNGANGTRRGVFGTYGEDARLETPVAESDG